MVPSFFLSVIIKQHCLSAKGRWVAAGEFYPDDLNPTLFDYTHTVHPITTHPKATPPPLSFC
ncbi:hypothetical protein AC579_4905 [Pseudocercospora musae]|uniref:Uncharacterized protein n=1 Tax=Pseudocercospora musae TaxID=113226 RepID=A0A139IE96_9PEZI|nr:hypothetical protein AC579_4905 [Pseudocercospora musae]